MSTIQQEELHIKKEDSIATSVPYNPQLIPKLTSHFTTTFHIQLELQIES